MSIEVFFVFVILYLAFAIQLFNWVEGRQNDSTLYIPLEYLIGVVLLPWLMLGMLVFAIKDKFLPRKAIGRAQYNFTKP